MTNKVVRKGLNVKEAADYCGVSKPTFIREIRDLIPHRRAGRRRIFSTDSLDRWLSAEEGTE